MEEEGGESNFRRGDGKLQAKMLGARLAGKRTRDQQWSKRKAWVESILLNATKPNASRGKGAG